MNFIQIAGRLGKDPETRFTADGKKVTSFSVATNKKRKGQDATIWYKVTVWGEHYDRMLGYLKKGSAVVVLGELEAKLYTDKSGNTQVSLEITPWNIGFSPFGKEQEKPATAPSVVQSEPMKGQSTLAWESEPDLPF